jgi:hypothetical protein
MGRRKNRSSYEYNHTPTTLMVALLGGSCAFLAVETTLPDVMDLWGSKLPGWQLQMAGIVTFFICLFLLELHETKSRKTAWRASAPWLSLIGLTLLATITHIPYFIVILVGTICSVWAYRQTSSVRRWPRLS